MGDEISIIIAGGDVLRTFLSALRDALEPRGVFLQAWDVGQDDWPVSLAAKTISAQEARAAMRLTDAAAIEEVLL